MPVFQEMTREELEAQKARLLEEYAAFQATVSYTHLTLPTNSLV